MVKYNDLQTAIQTATDQLAKQTEIMVMGAFLTSKR
jgi:hypothetical protein